MAQGRKWKNTGGREGKLQLGRARTSENLCYREKRAKVGRFLPFPIFCLLLAFLPHHHGPYLAREARDNEKQREGAFAFGFHHIDIAHSM